MKKLSMTLLPLTVYIYLIAIVIKEASVTIEKGIFMAPNKFLNLAVIHGGLLTCSLIFMRAITVSVLRCT